MADDCVVILSDDESNSSDVDQEEQEYDEEEDSSQSEDEYSTTSKDIEEYLGITLQAEGVMEGVADELSCETGGKLSSNQSVDQSCQLEGTNIEQFSLRQTELGGLKRTLVDRDGVDDECVTKVVKISTSPQPSVQLSSVTDSTEVYRRLHELECERRNLTEQLFETKEGLLYSEKALTETKDLLEKTKEKFDKTTEQLRTELIESQLKNSELLAETEYYHTHSTVTETVNSNTQQIIDDYTRQLRELQCQVKEQQTKDIELLRAQRTITVLTRKLNALEEDSKIVSLMKGQLKNYDSVVCKNELLEQQNKALKQRVGNVELLKYQLQTERDKVTVLEEKVAELDRVKMKNELNSSDIETQSNPSIVVLKYKLLDVQQREILLTRNIGELQTKLNIAKQEIKSVKLRNCSLEKQLTAEKEENRIKAEAIHRLERRLQFITKEREGCVNVLNSYKLDGGAESVLREQLKELQSTLKRYEDEVSDLQQKNEEMSKTINKTKKELVLSNHEVIMANEKMELIQQQCQELQMEKQKFEEMLSDKSPTLQ